MADMEQDLRPHLADLLGPGGLLTDPRDMAPYCTDWRGLYHGTALAVARPADTASLAALVRACGQAGVPMVPQGGNTSMVGGAAPQADGRAVVVSLARMNRVRALDPLDMTLTVDAGTVLKAAQDAAADAGCFLPLSIGAEGSATIGGVLATNAGGNFTVRYGNARDLVLGLEVVTAAGEVWDGLRRLRKDNTGYCLRQLFVGSEGTLGFITAAVLKLEPAPRARATAFCAAPSAEAVLALFARARRSAPGALEAFEYMSAASLGLVLAQIAGTALPLATPAPAYALIEFASPREGEGLREALEAVLEAALEAGEILDATLAGSGAQRAALWKLREEHSEAQKRAGANVKNDVSVPVSRIPEFLSRARAAAEGVLPGVRVIEFGHIGDGNIHYNLLLPEGCDPAAFLARGDDLMHAVGDVVRALDGSFSAEHGVGRLKTHMLPEWRGGTELALMQAIKTALDPRGLFNPGVMFSPAAHDPAARDGTDHSRTNGSSRS